MLTLTPITDLADLRLATVLQIYEQAFPPHEKMPVTFWADLFRGWVTPAAGSNRRHTLLSIEGADGATVGMALAEVIILADGERAGWLYYFAVAADRRGGGLGTDAFHALLDWFEVRQGCATVLWEVETAEAGEVAVRREAWYRREGGRRLCGVTYHEQVGDFPPLPLHLLFHAADENTLTAQRALLIAQEVLSAPVIVDGPLSFL